MEVAAAKQLLPMARGGAPNSPSSSTSSSSPSSAAASPSPRQQPQQSQVPPSPKPVPRIIDTTPFPTTFVQADTANFKQVVQRLTGSDTPPPTATAAQKPAKISHGHHHQHHHNHGGVGSGPKKPAFKLYERRIGKNNLKMIAPLAMAAAAAAGASPRKAAAAPEVLSPSVLDFPSLALGSPVTPLQLADPFNRSPASASPGEDDAERAAIARKGFFLHPSPRAAADPPRLLPLFPVTSPRMAPSPAPSPLQ